MPENNKSQNVLIYVVYGGSDIYHSDTMAE